LPSLPTVSIIDDDASVRVALERIVRSMDLKAHTFESRRDSLESPYLNNTSCLIADVQMPGMNGLKLQRTLKTKGLAISLILITAYPDDKLCKQALDAVQLPFWASRSKELRSSSALNAASINSQKPESDCHPASMP
jgi:FixJ family two-component response regulator